MLRNGGLLHLQSIDNLSYWPFLQRQIIEYLSPPRLSNSIESIRSGCGSRHVRHHTFRHGNVSRTYFSNEKAVCQSYLQSASENCYAESVQKKKAAHKRRSGCPLNASVEMLGDRWSLLILRDMMLGGYRTFNEFLHSDEKIATNILTDRLRRLESYGIVETERDPTDGRKMIYALTPKGIDLAPVLTEMVLWAARHEETANQALVRQMRTGKDQLIASVQQRWAELKQEKQRLAAAHRNT